MFLYVAETKTSNKANKSMSKVFCGMTFKKLCHAEIWLCVSVPHKAISPPYTAQLPEDSFMLIAVVFHRQKMPIARKEKSTRRAKFLEWKPYTMSLLYHFSRNQTTQSEPSALCTSF